MSLHTTADDPTVYRDANEVEPWESRCPIARFEKYLINKGALNAEMVKEIQESSEQDALRARDTFYNMPPANPEEIFDHLYETFPEELRLQQQEYIERLRNKGVDE